MAMTSTDPRTDQSPVAPDHVVDFHFQNTYARLPDHFHARVPPTPVPAPRLIKLNEPLARFLNLDVQALASPEGIEILAGNRIAPGSEPLAIAYAGHQFGHFVPQLGDGRANLLGEIIAHDGRRYDLQLKGSGPTPFSRRGDGRAALGPVLREYLLSEAMAALGIPTTRALAAVLTGASLVRETVVPGAVFTRVAASHLRVGTFQYFAARRDIEGLRTLADYAIARHYPEAAAAQHPYRALLEGVVTRQAHLVAQWMHLGFVHGVMNTDNTSVSGETIDYGPCAFLEAYHPDTVFSSIDQHGRYSYSNQPAIMLWNLTRLAETLLPLLRREENSTDAIPTAEAALAAFQPHFEAAHRAGWRRKLGLLTEQEGDDTLVRDLLALMTANRADFTLTFRRLSDAALNPDADAELHLLFADRAAYDSWSTRWRQRLHQEPVPRQERVATMRRANPTFIPRNHLVEAVISAAVNQGDFQPFHDLLQVVTHPYGDTSGQERFAIPARSEQLVHHTFCGT